MRKILGLTLLLAGAAGFAMAQQLTTPEIDPGSAVSAIALLSGGLVVFWGSRRRK